MLIILTKGEIDGLMLGLGLLDILVTVQKSPASFEFNTYSQGIVPYPLFPNQFPTNSEL